MSSTNIYDVEEKGLHDQEHLEHKGGNHDHVVHEANKAVLAQAVAAEDQEHMPVWDALRLFPRATFWSFMVSFVIVCLIPVQGLRLTTDHGSVRRRSDREPHGTAGVPETLRPARRRRDIPGRASMAKCGELCVDNRRVCRHHHLRLCPATPRLQEDTHRRPCGAGCLHFRRVLRRDAPGPLRRPVPVRAPVGIIQRHCPGVRI